MKRLFAIGLSLLMLVGFSADAVEISECALQRYADWDLGISSGYRHYRGWGILQSGNNHMENTVQLYTQY